MDKIVNEVAQMGFSQQQVYGVIQQLTASGKNVDVNVVLDRLMSGGGGAVPTQLQGQWSGAAGYR